MQDTVSRRAGRHYHPLSIAVHWLTLLLLVAVYALVELRDFFPKHSDPRQAMRLWHEMLGLALLGLVFVRLLLRRAFAAPPITPVPPAWQQRLAAAMHAALYAFLLVMPLLGWLMLGAKGQPVPFFGLELPALTGPNKALGDRLEDLHEAIGTIGYALVGLHAAAALVHHHLMRDDTLSRMLPRPGRGASGRQPWPGG